MSAPYRDGFMVGMYANTIAEGVEPTEFQFMVRPVEPGDGRLRCDHGDPSRCDRAPTATRAAR